MSEYQSMSFRLQTVVPWGRSFDEYRRMFSLDENDLTKKIVGCGDGPSSFNAEMKQRGHRVVSVDPIYLFSRTQIQQRIERVTADIVTSARNNSHAYSWHEISSPEELERRRLAAMNIFLTDYDQGKREGRYTAHALPLLGFAERCFDLALCSHLLFTYSHLLSAEFHIQSILEMLRVAREVRLFPLLTMDGNLCPYLERVVLYLKRSGLRPTIEPVEYEFQRGANQMLRISS